jgi:hypothetical protein
VLHAAAQPGIKGFWYQYANIEALVRELGIPDPFTDWTTSSFYTPGGLQVGAGWLLGRRLAGGCWALLGAGRCWALGACCCRALGHGAAATQQLARKRPGMGPAATSWPTSLQSRLRPPLPAVSPPTPPTPPRPQVTSPVFQDLPRLPTPLGSFVHTHPLFTNLSVQDRLSALPLVRALLEFDGSEEAYAQYDAMSAYELFRWALAGGGG